ncbi:expansin EXLX1 family cellulose-binding protein [Sphaerisporangium aureirubrum]|uniref:Expansin EXLX1 family cellulose-binding protein n=1 Tax=Sphaerisporangium aureirubrum TaxID=1544736 RepID=A0ABW1NT69_9ACTN
MSVERRLAPALRRRVAWTAWVAAACTLVVLGGQAGRDAACAAASGPARAGWAAGREGGTCSLPGAPPGRHVAAVSAVEYAGAAACGAYLDVTGPLGTVRVQVVEECRACALGELDMSRPAFDRIAGLDGGGVGRVRVRYHTVRNPEVPLPVAFRLKRGASPGLLAIQAIDHGNPLRTLEIRERGRWRHLPRAADNYWMTPGGAGSGPYTVRITDVYGQRLTARGIHLAFGRIQRTTHRLYSPASSSPAPRLRTTTSRPRNVPDRPPRPATTPPPVRASAPPAVRPATPPAGQPAAPPATGPGAASPPAKTDAGPPVRADAGAAPDGSTEVERYGAAAQGEPGGEPVETLPPKSAKLAALPTSRPFLC